MSNRLFTAGDCPRCEGAEAFMRDAGLAFEQLDVKADGMPAFREFYAAHRDAVHRTDDGIEFPIFTDGTIVKQGVGLVVAHLKHGATLDAFLRPSRLGKGWIDGLIVSGGDASDGDALVDLLTFLKANDLRTQIDTDGRNADLLERVVAEGLADRVVMEVRGPASRYAELLGGEVDVAEIEKSMAVVATCPDYAFSTTLVPFVGQDGSVGYLGPNDLRETASWIKTATGGNQHPYRIRRQSPSDLDTTDERLRDAPPLPDRKLILALGAVKAILPQAELQLQ